MSVIGNRPITVRELNSAPQRLFDKVMTKELDAKWNAVYEKVPSNTIYPDENAICLQLVPKMNEDETEMLGLKERRVFHRNRDKDHFLVRQDYISADLCSVRIMLYLLQILDFLILTARS